MDILFSLKAKNWDLQKISPEFHLRLRDLVLCRGHVAGCVYPHATLFFAALGSLPCGTMCGGHSVVLA